MALGSQENQGFREATVEMEVSPLRALTQKGHLQGARIIFVEMEVSPLRALTRRNCNSDIRCPH